MARIAAAVVMAGCVFATSNLVQASEVKVMIDVPMSDQEADRNDPSCSGSNKITTADQVVNGVGKAIDAYVGVPIIETTFSNPDIRKAVSKILGTDSGRSRCAMLCLTVPKNANVQLFVGAHQHGGGDQRYIGPWEGPAQVGKEEFPGIAFSKFEAITKASSDNVDVYCSLAKNWRASFSRWMWLRAVY